MSRNTRRVILGTAIAALVAGPFVIVRHFRKGNPPFP